MKSQLLEKFEQLMQTDDIMSIRDAVRDLKNDWKSETAKENQLQLELYNSTEHAEGEEFEFIPNALDERQSELVKIYRERIEEHGRKLAAERQHNLELKQALLRDFEQVIREEQNVGKAFSSWNFLKEKWQAIGDIPGDRYHEMNDRYHKLTHEFFYNIKIYRELQENDLKINQKKKEEMIGRAKELAEIKSINELEMLVKTYQREWMEIGPSPRDSYKELGDTFFGLLREAQTRINHHYLSLRSQSEENMSHKRNLVAKLKHILSYELNTISGWNKYTNEVLALQEAWRHTGFALKKDNEEIWTEFRGLCDLFFNKKKQWFDIKKTEYRSCREKKEAFIASAIELQASNDWKSTTDTIKKLQEEWKTIGSADPRDEQKLWQRFRAACDVFFQKKKEHFSGMITQQEENLLKKEELIKELEAFQLSGNQLHDVQNLKNFSGRWNELGFVPREKVKDISGRFNALLDAHYGKLKLERSERIMTEFRSRLSNMRSNGNGNYQMNRERQALRDRLDQLERERRQYENNLGIFKGAGADALKKDIEKKIQFTEQLITEAKQKLQLIDT